MKFDHHLLEMLRLDLLSPAHSDAAEEDGCELSQVPRVAQSVIRIENKACEQHSGADVHELAVVEPLALAEVIFESWVRRHVE